MGNIFLEPFLLTMWHNRNLNLTFCMLFCLVSRAGLVCQSSLKFPWVLHRKGAGADVECASAVTAQDLEFLIGSGRVCSHLCFGDLCQSLRGQSRWPLKGGCLVSTSMGHSGVLCAENPRVAAGMKTQQALGNPWQQHCKGRGSPGLPGWFDCD